MGVPTQLSAPHGARRGIALPSALFAIVAVMVLALGVVGIADARLRAAKDRDATARAVLLAEEGIAHGLTILKDSLKGTSMTRLLVGSDATAGTTDDGLLAGYTLSNNINIPAGGRVTSRGRYEVQIEDDPADPAPSATVDGNLRIVLRCTATTTDGASATIKALIAGRPNYGVVVDGNMTFNGGNLQVRGNCGAVHANGSVSGGGAGPHLAGLTASGTITGTYTDTLSPYPVITPTAGVPALPVPPLDLDELCSRADYVFRIDGMFVDRTNPLSIPVPMSAAVPTRGFIRSAVGPPFTYTANNTGGTQIGTGTYCAEGNVVVGGTQGSAAAPIRASIISRLHSISVAGNPYFIAASSDSVQFAANGDLNIAGLAVAGSVSYEGMMYANAQCIIAGTVTLRGSIVCRNQPQPANATEYNTGASAPCPTGRSCISGSAQIVHSCNGWLNGTPYIKAWYQPTN